MSTFESFLEGVFVGLAQLAEEEEQKAYIFDSFTSVIIEIDKDKIKEWEQAALTKFYADHKMTYEEFDKLVNKRSCLVEKSMGWDDSNPYTGFYLKPISFDGNQMFQLIFCTGPKILNTFNV